MRFFFMTLFSFISSLALLNCSGEHTHDHDDAGQHQHSNLECPAEITALQYEDNISAESNNTVFRFFLNTTPAPIDVGMQTISAEIDTLEGDRKYISSVELIPWMPQHGHGTSPSRFSAEIQESFPERYVFRNVNLMMPGCWKLDFEISYRNNTEETSETIELVTFYFILEG
jgi:hypothetical protein